MGNKYKRNKSSIKKLCLIISLICLLFLICFFYIIKDNSLKNIDKAINKYRMDNKVLLQEYYDNHIYVKDLIKEGYLKKESINLDKINLDTSYYVIGFMGSEVLEKHIYYKNKKYIKVNKKFSDILKNKHSDEIKRKDDKYYYIGKKVNNYVLYNNILWRIISFNDKEINLISEEALTSIYSGKEIYNDSYIYSWLNDYFTTKINYNKNITSVRLLSKKEYNNSLKDKKNFLQDKKNYYYINDNNKINIYNPNLKKVIKASNKTAYSIKPVITLKGNIKVLYGNGSLKDYYVIDELKDKKELLNKKNIGSYVIYSNYLWRIIDIDENGNTKLKYYDKRDRKPFYAYDSDISSEKCIGFESDGYISPYQMNIKGCTNKFNKEQKNGKLMIKNQYHAGGNNIAYYLNSEEDKDSFYNSLENKKLIEKHKWNVTEYNIGDNYKKDKEEYITEKIGMISVGEMFSGNDDNFYYYTLTPSKDNKINYINFDGKIIKQYSSLPIGVRPVLYLKSTVKTISGNGTLDKPYKIK